MQIKLQLKRLGKKKIKSVDFEIEKSPENLRELIAECVKREVERYNHARENVKLLSFLSPKEIQEKGEQGKISFDNLENRELADVNSAISDALLAFKDGLFTVFVDDDEITKTESPLNLTNESRITFIRLTFLVGTYW